LGGENSHKKEEVPKDGNFFLGADPFPPNNSRHSPCKVCRKITFSRKKYFPYFLFNPSILQSSNPPILQSSNPPILQSSNPPIPDKPPGIFCPLSFFIFQPPNIFYHGIFAIPKHFKSFLAGQAMRICFSPKAWAFALLFIASLSVMHAQLWCGSSQSCGLPVGIGGKTSPSMALPISLP
jgi:hypothetical protein